jgi:hypothetical protein
VVPVVELHQTLPGVLARLAILLPHQVLLILMLYKEILAVVIRLMEHHLEVLAAAVHLLLVGTVKLPA